MIIGGSINCILKQIFVSKKNLCNGFLQRHPKSLCVESTSMSKAIMKMSQTSKSLKNKILIPSTIHTSSPSAVCYSTTTTSSSNGSRGFKFSKRYPLTPSEKIIKYVIGEKGKNINEIQQRSQCRVSIEENSRGVVIGGENEQSVQFAWNLIEETLRDFGWRFDRQRQTFYEIQSEGELQRQDGLLNS